MTLKEPETFGAFCYKSKSAIRFNGLCKERHPNMQE